MSAAQVVETVADFFSSIAEELFQSGASQSSFVRATCPSPDAKLLLEAVAEPTLTRKRLFTCPHRRFSPFLLGHVGYCDSNTVGLSVIIPDQETALEGRSQCPVA